MSRKFTDEQEDYICYMIGEWYLQWKSNICSNDGTHRLGYAKEQLKCLILGMDMAGNRLEEAEK